jgi:hypothetical protein
MKQKPRSSLNERRSLGAVYVGPSDCQSHECGAQVGEAFNEVHLCVFLVQGQTCLSVGAGLGRSVGCVVGIMCRCHFFCELSLVSYFHCLSIWIGFNLFVVLTAY